MCASAALVATWPLVAHLTTSVPLGTEHEATVPLFSMWNLWWTADRLPHAMAGFLNAPFFHPNHDVTTYSEPMPLTGLFAAPLWGLGAPPALIYNLALLGLLTLNGLFAYRVVRALDLPMSPALLAGVLTVTLPIGAKLLGVLPNLALFGVLWTLDGLIRFGRNGSPRSAAWAAAGLVATFYTFEQWMLLFAPLAVAAGLVALSLQRFRRAAVVPLVAAGAVAGLAILPLALPTSLRHSDLGFMRPAALVRGLSADAGDFVTRPPTASLPVPRRDPADTAGLFPGILLGGLALGGAVLAVRSTRWKRWGLWLIGGVAFSVVLALGLKLDLGGWRPFATLRGVSRAFAELRSPYRAAALAQLFLPVLAAFALWRLRRLVPRWGTLLIVVVGLLAAGENLAIPAPLVRIPHSPRTEWTAWLHAQPDRRVVTHVPLPAGFGVKDYEPETRRMFAQIDHHKPIVNGYSGFFPVGRTPEGKVFPVYAAFQVSMSREFPSYELLCVLIRSLGSDTLVADRDWLAAHGDRMQAFGAFLRPVYRDRDVQIYALQAPANRCRAA
ncbi:MAG: hypothetical protein M3R70_05550 [Actinomycetota bacterium]|nr:hypothetical protein [Actinomycetota bacterium]